MEQKIHFKAFRHRSQEDQSIVTRQKKNLLRIEKWNCRRRSIWWIKQGVTLWQAVDRWAGPFYHKHGHEASWSVVSLKNQATTPASFPHILACLLLSTPLSISGEVYTLAFTGLFRVKIQRVINKVRDFWKSEILVIFWTNWEKFDQCVLGSSTIHFEELCQLAAVQPIVVIDVGGQDFTHDFMRP